MKKVFISIVTIVIIGSIIYFYSTTRNIWVLQEMEASEFSKIEIWNNDEPAVLTEQEDIQRFLDVLQSTRIHKRKSPDKAGGWISVFLYYKNGEQDEMAISIDQINVGDGEYKSEKNILHEIDELYEEFLEKSVQ